MRDAFLHYCSRKYAHTNVQATSAQGSLKPVLRSAPCSATDQRTDEASIGFLDEELQQEFHDQKGGCCSIMLLLTSAY
jgi:hypothetical protein